jgi:hypothetical protein
MTMITMILQVFGNFAVIERESMMSGTRAASAPQLLADRKATNFTMFFYKRDDESTHIETSHHQLSLLKQFQLQQLN